MPIYALGDDVPDIHPDAFVHPEAVIIGRVTVGPESSIWPCAVLRGDSGGVGVGGIVIGARTSVQDGAVIHCTHEVDTVVGDDCVVGHLAHLEGCTVESGSLVGTASVVLHRAAVRTGGLVGAKAFVGNDVEVPSGAMALGVPAQIKPDRVPPGMIAVMAKIYVGKARRYRAELRRIG